MFDRQAPDIEVVADCHDNVDDKRPVHTDCEAQTRKDKRDLVDVVAQAAWPPNANVCLQDRAQAVQNAKRQWQNQYVVHWKSSFGQVCSDHLPNAVGIDEANVPDKGNKVVAENHWLQVEICRDQYPGGEEWEKTKERISSVFATSAACLHDILSTERPVNTCHVGDLYAAYLCTVLKSSTTPP